MAQINIQGLVSNISEKTNVYTAIIEAIVNSIDAIDSSKKNDGEIEVIIKRKGQMSLELSTDALPDIESIEIRDNGVGFTKVNRDSFDTLYGDQKVKLGGKGFGRFMYLKYFNSIEVDSTYEEEGKKYQRTFQFTAHSGNREDLIENEIIKDHQGKSFYTSVNLKNLKTNSTFNKRLTTIARILVEKLLPYFIDEKYRCPSIVLKEFDEKVDVIKLNSYFEDYDAIQKVNEYEFVLENDKEKELFKIKIFKIFFSRGTSSIIMTAHNRAVTTEPLYEYVPEFKDEFFDLITSDSGEKSSKNYSIKAYVLGNYLNKNVSLERNGFSFSKQSDLMYPFGSKDIESKAASFVSSQFEGELRSRKQKKRDRVIEYVDKKAPWHKSYLDDLDFSVLPYQFDDETIEGQLQTLKYQKDKIVRNKVKEILEANQDEKQKSEKVKEISKELTKIGKSDLVHYLILRKVILDLLKNSLKWSADKKYEKERIIHSLIFPMNSDSDHISYDEHNLWVIDERLSFSEYVASDKPLNRQEEKPDLLIFDKPIAVRDVNELSNPITIFEFKRPQRKEYGDGDDPILQIFSYVDKIRKGNFKDIDGRNIKANENTPAYGFLICDLNEKIKLFCKNHQLNQSPDGEGYYGYHVGYQVYIEVVSFDKLVKDSELRNRIFFKKLGIA